jgi:peptide subunit release factor RF-3
MRDDSQFTPEELMTAKKYDNEKTKKLRETLAKSAEEARVARLIKRGVDQEVAKAVTELDAQKIEEIRQKLEGLDTLKNTTKKLSEGTKPSVEIEDLTEYAEEIENDKTKN